ncbi:glucosidase [Chroococcidiopsidales cyanobacterium LEGE 13417]|uniref:MGH1-like glycoside hydrolase domain-containing protein n=1 Tax=Chroococcidiopsis sp. CCALA 051 TaxID=869949 RepID=UPI0018EC18DB|nr:glucosidase [Chroococcidiopsis sp. CCALA 051]MBE9016317.1 glucosidase [Chroococcidiopsidales cyanobacterium LEGE 13417]
MTQEEQRLQEDRDRKAHWRRWGSYLSERQWGTVREDYSADGSAWDYFSHEQARSRAYRWGEDGIAGISDNHQRLCFAIALWNGVDPILKERLFGLTGNEGNHGEDVKECYFYLDNTPTHSYMKYLYKYSQQAFPYTQLVTENQNRSKRDREFELLDTGIFDNNTYFDVFVEYAKNTPEDILIKISIANRALETRNLYLLPTLWFRNTWAWGRAETAKPRLKKLHQDSNLSIIESTHPSLGDRWLYCEGTAELLFTENDTNYQKLFGVENKSDFVKDGINDYLINRDKTAIDPQQIGTKFAANYNLKIAAGETVTICLRLCDSPYLVTPFGKDFEQIFQTRIQEANEFYDRITSPCQLTPDRRNIQRQAFAGMLWAKQYYYYVIHEWLQGDPAHPTPAKSRQNVRNTDWIHLFNDDVISMPDKWEYPWYAAWDLAFHVIPLAIIDPDFAKRQLSRLTREWYLHPNGQLPAYEWNFSDVNPPVHAWATWRIYKIEQKIYGRADRLFLERVFQKLLLNFTWWVNRKDIAGKNVFQGGFLGMDNIGVFDRSTQVPTDAYLQQSDGTSWMGMYCLNMLAIALELAKENPAYEDTASKFFEHFLYIADAMNSMGEERKGLWDKDDSFYYDMLHVPADGDIVLKVRSLVGLIPLLAVETLEPDVLERLPGFKKRMEWFINNRPDLRQNVACMETKGIGARRLLAICYKPPGGTEAENKLRCILKTMLDENEFLSPYGIRSVSKYHASHPYSMKLDGQEYHVKYEPAESSNAMFGGNSNWRGPVWFPINYLIIEALQKFHYYLGDNFKIEFPTDSGREMNLWEVSQELSQRLIKIFLQDESGKRPVYGDLEKFQTDPHWHNLIMFHEYFHGDNGAGLGANHQTGWTGLVAKLIQQCGEYDR